jgi:serine/threonine protein kinase
MNKYDKGKMIGKGSYGSVYLVRRRTDGKQLVMKIMTIQGVSQKETDSLIQEAKLLQKLVWLLGD